MHTLHPDYSIIISPAGNDNSFIFYNTRLTVLIVILLTNCLHKVSYTKQPPMKIFTHILSICAVLVLGACSDDSRKSSLAVVQKGAADISGWDYSSLGEVELKGDWEFYYGRLLEPQDFKKPSVEKPSYIKVPNAWDSFVYNGKKIGSYGFSTYRLNIHTGSDDPLSFKIMPPNSAYKLWANGVFHGECGKVAQKYEDEIPMFRTMIYNIKPVNKQIELIIQVSNHSIYLGGIIIPVSAGPAEIVYTERTNKIAFDVFIFASLIVISIYYMGLFLMRTSDMSYIYFSIFTLLLAARSLVTNEMYLYQIFPDADWQMMCKIDFLATTLCVPVFIYFIYLLHPVARNNRIRMFFVVCAVIYSYLILFFPARIYSPYLTVFNIITIIGCIYIVNMLVRFVAARQEGAQLALIGFILLFGTVINDVLSVNNIIHTIQLSSIGVFCFVMSQSIISSMKFANAYRRIEDLSHNLEIKVRTRTSELEHEKEMLRIRNSTIENELTIAKKIQKQLIPRHSPVENIYAFYKPMDKVGGDFYDFLKYRDTDKIGIFLSDVSGHGVPAAFITSMVKTSILQAGADREDPSLLLTSLNELLLNQTGGHFVTAFYGIFSPSTRDFMFSNSGHNPPYKISQGCVSTIEGNKSIPLAIMNTASMASGNKTRSNSTITLEKGSKILFFTDGLTETVSKNDSKVFFEDMLTGELLLKYSSLPPIDFIYSIYKELVNFHGSESFEDDVCMICMDVE